MSPVVQVVSVQMFKAKVAALLLREVILPSNRSMMMMRRRRSLLASEASHQEVLEDLVVFHPSSLVLQELEEIRKSGMKNFRNIQVEESNLLAWQGLIVPVSTPGRLVPHQGFLC